MKSTVKNVYFGVFGRRRTTSVYEGSYWVERRHQNPPPGWLGQTQCRERAAECGYVLWSTARDDDDAQPSWQSWSGGDIALGRDAQGGIAAVMFSTCESVRGEAENRIRGEDSKFA